MDPNAGRTPTQRRTLAELIGAGERPTFGPDLGPRLRERIEGVVGASVLREPLRLGKPMLDSPWSLARVAVAPQATRHVSHWDRRTTTAHGGTGDGPAYTEPGVTYRVTGYDRYGLDGNDNDGWGCEQARRGHDNDPQPRTCPANVRAVVRGPKALAKRVTRRWAFRTVARLFR